MDVLVKGQNLPLAADEVVVNVRCAGSPAVAAILAGGHHDTGNHHALTIGAGTSRSGVTVDRGGAGTTLQVRTRSVPDDVQRIIVLANLDGADRLSFAACGPVAVSMSANDDRPLMRYDIDAGERETAILCIELYRRGVTWKVRALGQGFVDGLTGVARHLGVHISELTTSVEAWRLSQVGGDVKAVGAAGQEPARMSGLTDLDAPSGSAPGAAPSASSLSPRAVNLDKGRVSLAKGASVTLVKTGSRPLETVTMGLGWDPAVRGKSIDLDASVIAYDSDGRDLAKVWFLRTKAFHGSIVHSGDNLTGDGEGDDEAIRVELTRLPAKVTTLLFTVNSFSGQTFDMVTNSYCRLIDDRGGELVRYALTDTKKVKGVYMCRLDRTAAGPWVMTALGIFHDSMTVKGMVKAARRLVF